MRGWGQRSGRWLDYTSLSISLTPLSFSFLFFLPFPYLSPLCFLLDLSIFPPPPYLSHPLSVSPLFLSFALSSSLLLSHLLTHYLPLPISFPSLLFFFRPLFLSLAPSFLISILLPPAISFSLSLSPFLPLSSGKLSQLRELNVSYNRLTRVPPELGDCENLERLELTGNHLAELPFEVTPNPGAPIHLNTPPWQGGAGRSTSCMPRFGRYSGPV